MTLTLRGNTGKVFCRMPHYWNLSNKTRVMGHWEEMCLVFNSVFVIKAVALAQLGPPVTSSGRQLW